MTPAPGDPREQAFAPDVTQLKAITHPVRMRLLGLLRTHGPATASQVARRLGLNSGATSYHLRQLAAHGFVEEASDLGNRRERWWRASSLSTTVRSADEVDDAARDAGDAFAQLAVSRAAGRMQEAVERRGGLPPEWREVTSISDLQVPVTAAQAKEIQDRFEALVWDVLGQYRVEPGPIAADQRRYVAVVATFPNPEDERGWDEDEGVEDGDEDGGDGHEGRDRRDGDDGGRS